jgi:hypothetical protein
MNKFGEIIYIKPYKNNKIEFNYIENIIKQIIQWTILKEPMAIIIN